LFDKRPTAYITSILILLSSLVWAVRNCDAQETKKPFTVSDEIALTLFNDLDGRPPEIHFSPDGNYFAVWSQRGRLDLNVVEDSLRFFRTQDVNDFMEHSEQSHPPAPIWVLTRSCKEAEDGGGISNDWRWLSDSSGVAFLEHTASGNQRLVMADLRKKTIESLTPTTERVDRFDIRDRKHYVYLGSDRTEGRKVQDEDQPSAVVGTGRSIYELIFPADPISMQISSSSRNDLWAVLGNKHFKVEKNGVPLILEQEFSLSPDGNSLVTILPVHDVPQSWETLYPPPYASSRSRIHSGHDSAHQYVRIDLQTGSVESLTGAPTADDAGWGWGGRGPSWASDGQEILLPGTFLSSRDNAPSRPCIAVLEILSNTRTCVEVLKVRTDTAVEDGYHTILGAQFVSGDSQRLLVNFINRVDESHDATEYKRTVDGSWQVSGQIKGIGKAEHNGLRVTVKQGLNDPPQLVATNKEASRVIWDPNPQLKNLEWGEASAYKWKDKEGREWRGGLYKPVNYKPGQRYPLVIQNHGFDESRFLPSGVFPTSFAARALAAQGIAVLQAGAGSGNCKFVTSGEAPCFVDGYESAANQLVAEGLVDSERIGIIGFSRTCFYVMEMLTTGSLHLKAASITDGVMFDYWQYMLNPERSSREANRIMETPPYGKGLQQWLNRSPGFNLDKINTPLMVVGEGPVSLLSMWEPYSMMHYLRKPVELVMLNTHEHTLTNPAVRLASQGGTVDWFRFWLQDYEDPDHPKSEQYVRWRGLRKMQEENEKKK